MRFIMDFEIQKIAANRTFAKSRFAANRTATKKIMGPKQKQLFELDDH